MQAAKTEIGLDQYWLIIKRRWLLAGVIFGATVAAFNYWASIQTPIYEAQGKLRIKSSDSSSTLTQLGELDDVRGQLRALNDEESPIDTEIELMTTTPMIRAAIERLNYRNEEGDPIRVDEFLNNLDISSEGDTDILNVNYQSADVELAEAVVNALMKVYVERNLLDNRAEAVAAREFIEKQLPDAERRALQAEAALRNFKERNQVIALEAETEETVSSLNDIKEKITDASAQLFGTKAQYDLLGSRIGKDPQTALLAVAVSQSEGIQRVLSEYQQVEALLASERVRFQDQHPIVIDLQSKLNNLNSLLSARIKNVVGSQPMPSAINLQSGGLEIGLVRDYLNLESQIVGLQQRTKALRDAEKTYTARGRLLPQLEQEQRQLQRKLDAAESTYRSLLQALQEVRVFENKNVGNATIVQPAESLSGIVAPDEDKYFISGVMLGTLLAVGAVLLLETKDKSIKTVQEARESFGRPVLGVIPSFKELSRKPLEQLGRTGLGMVPGLSLLGFHNAVSQPKLTGLGDREIPPLIAGDATRSLASESFHMLRNNLKFLNSDSPPTVIAVTSAGPYEGKSTVASNLAASIAQTGKQVLLIDADLHHPIQHWIWDVGSRYGLSDLLVGQLSCSEVLIKTQSNLTVLLAGSLPPDPAALLDSKKMVGLLDNFHSQFDYVILDAPSLRSVASTSILGKMVDGLLLVVRPGVADKTSVNYAKELIAQSQQNVLGIVVNGTLSRYEPYTYFLSERFYGEEVTMHSETASVAAVSGRRR